MIYLDSAATTQIDPEVLDAMMPYFRKSIVMLARFTVLAEGLLTLF